MGALVVQMPGLSEHREDIPELAASILCRKAREAARDCPRLTQAALDRLVAFDWPGNVRQLEPAMEHYVAFGKLPDLVRRPGRKRSEWEGELEETLRRNGGEVSAAARELRISRKTLYRALKRSGA